MVRRVVFCVALLVAALSGVRTGLAAPISSSTTPGNTGNAEADFPLTNPNVQVINIPDAMNRVAQPQWMTSQGWVTGWAIKDIRTLYNPKSDTLFVGVNFFGIAGDADGNGNPGVADPRLLAAGGVDLPHLGGDKSITVAIDTNHSGVPTLVAGVPSDKSQAGPGLDGFNVASYKNAGSGIENSFGQTLTGHLGQLLYDPSAQHPDFEFSITHFSTLPGVNLNKGFWLEAFAGSGQDVVVGEDYVSWTNLATPAGQVITPEPATLLGWSVVAVAGAAWVARARRRLTS